MTKFWKLRKGADLKMTNKPAESGHWYTKTGEPKYTIKGKNGKERNTNVKDARELGLVPSVTTILNIAAKPGLNNWFQQQAILAALTLPRKEGEPEKDYLDRVLSDSKAQGRDAADRGTLIHGQIQNLIENKAGNYPPYVFAAKKALDDYFGDQMWVCEESFAHGLGYGGKCDLNAYSHDNKHLVVDIKTKDKVDDKTAVYDEHIMQLAAYREGLNMQHARCANLFVDMDGNTKIIEHSEADVSVGWDCFYHLLRFYQRKNGL